MLRPRHLCGSSGVRFPVVLAFRCVWPARRFGSFTATEFVRVSSGFLAAGVCWSSQLLAAQALCGVAGSAGLSGGNYRVELCTAFTASALTLRGTTCTSGSCTVDAAAVSLVPTFSACEMDSTRDVLNLSMADGAAVGGAVIAVWGAAWAARNLRRLLAGSAGGDDVE